MRPPLRHRPAAAPTGADAPSWPLWLLPVLGVPALLSLPFLRGATLLFRDLLHFCLPQQVFAAAALAQGRLPLWNPLVYGGAPFLAEPGTGVFYPPNWLFQLLPPAQAATAFVLLHLPLAALGMLLLARECRLSRGAAALAATSFVTSGYLLSMHGGHYYFASAALLPLCAGLLVRCAREATALALVRAAACVALLALNGELQGLLLAALLAGALLLDGAAASGAPLADPPRGRAPQGDRARGWARRLAPLGLCAAAGMLGVALAAVQLLPSALFAHSTVRAHGVPLAEATLWSLQPLRLVELIVPQPFGLPFPDNGYWGPAPPGGPHHLPWALSLWLGPSALLLAPFAFAGRPRARALALVAALGLLLALGPQTPLFSLWVRLVPLADKFRYPEKYALLASAALVLLGARGLDAVRENVRTRRLALLPFASLAVLALAAALWAAQAPAPLVRAIALGLASAEANVAPADALAAFAASLLATGGFSLALALALLLSRLRPALLAPLFVLAGAAAGGANGLALLSYGDASFLAAPPPLVAAIRAATPPGSTGRTFSDGSCAFRGAGEGTLLERVRRFQWLSGKENFLTLLSVPEALGYGAAESAEQVALFRALRPAGLPAAMRVFGAAVQIGCDAGGVAQAGAVPGAVQRLRYVRAIAAPADPAERARALLAAPSGVALVDGAAPASGAAANARTGTASMLEDLPERIRLGAEGEGGVVVLADSFAPGWSATVDGAAAPMLRADAGFRAVALAAGAHEVIFSYRAPGLIAGAAVSLGAALLCAALLLLHLKRRGP